MTREFRENIIEIACQIADEFDRQEKEIGDLHQELENEKKKNKEFLRTIRSIIEDRISENERTGRGLVKFTIRAVYV